jgi:DNA-directed RNA polymerase specialized sigma24 family protein
MDERAAAAGNGEVAQLGQRLVALREEYGGVVRKIVARGRLEDREAAEAEVWARVWRALPRMVEREGKEHRWGAWVAMIARRVVIDEKRRDEVARRAWGVRAIRGAPEDGEELDLEIGGWVEPDAVPDASEWGEPYVHAERAAQVELVAEAMRGLTALERRVVWRWAGGEGERETAAALGMGWRNVRAARIVAIGKLQGMVRERGWE